MKITKKYLQKIIKEMLAEGFMDGGVSTSAGYGAKYRMDQLWLK